MYKDVIKQIKLEMIKVTINMKFTNLFHGLVSGGKLTMQTLYLLPRPWIASPRPATY